MAWDWSDTFKGLISGAIIWVVVYLRKKVIPFVKALRKFTRLVETVEKLESKLAIMESQKEGMYDIIRDPLYLLNEKGEVIYANNAWAKIGGLHDPRDGYGFGYMEMLPDDERDRLEKITKRLIEHPSPFEGIVRFKNKQTNEIVATECRTALIYDKDKKIIGTIGRLYVLKNT